MPHTTHVLLSIICLCALVVPASAREVSRSFELRYVTAAEKANGETDFKGKTSVFTTEQRLEFLSRYEQVAGKFFEDKDWDTQIVSDEDVRQTLRQLKPQPQPEVRRRLPLTDWKHLGSRPGQREEELRSLAEWSALPGVRLENNELVLSGTAPLEKTFEPQSWRFQLLWRILPPASGQRVTFELDGVVSVGLDGRGQYFYHTGSDRRLAGTCTAGQWHELKVEVDLETGRYNFLADGVLIADFVPLVTNRPVARITVQGGAGMRLDDLWGVGYAKDYDPEGDTHSRDVPFTIHTFLDERFQARPDVADWTGPGYDDSGWQSVPVWPYAHGGERHAGETLYLRTRIKVGEFERAELSGECLDPSGEIWINGRPVEVRRNRHPFAIDVTPYLKPGAENLVAVRVDPFKVTRTMRHTPADLHTGWFAGRLNLDLTARRWIKDVFVSTDSLTNGAAVMKVRALIRNDHVVLPEEREPKGDNGFKGRVSVAFHPWFPAASPTAAATASFPVSIELGRDFPLEGVLSVKDPALWSADSPQLYKVVVRLEDQKGQPIDDSVVTTGIRTISQEGGTFRINGKPSMMNGALVFGFRPPMDRIAQWLRCPPPECLVRELLTLKRMNANTVRMSHHDGPTGGVNDPRYAEMGDQLGVLFQWATPSWVRTDSPYLMDFEGLPLYVRQVRNHPSIVMWQPGNHPKFPDGFEEGMKWFKQVHDTIHAEDPTRLICPTASIGRLSPRNDDGTLDRNGKPVTPIPVWTAPMIARGDMDHATGYGAEWSELRKFPYPSKWEGEQGWREKGHKVDYLGSRERAYFDFESEESAGQPNWNLHKGKPQYQVRSYEIDMDRTSIGRRLTVDEWRISQAWQAMSGYEAYRKKRWLDYDGMAWCTLDGGGNTATYEKPLTDYYGQAKISYHAIKMAFQTILAGSKNVDVAYGPADKIPVVVFNLGPERTVDVTVSVRDLQDKEVTRKVFPAVKLQAGRTFTELGPLQFKLPVEEYYTFEYLVATSR